MEPTRMPDAPQPMNRKAPAPVNRSLITEVRDALPELEAIAARMEPSS
jgi:hypothetical protein